MLAGGEEEISRWKSRIERGIAAEARVRFVRKSIGDVGEIFIRSWNGLGCKGP